MPKTNSNKEKNIIISSTISAKYHQQLKEHCKKIDRNMSWVVKKQVENFLNNLNNQELNQEKENKIKEREKIKNEIVLPVENKLHMDNLKAKKLSLILFAPLLLKFVLEDDVFVAENNKNVKDVKEGEFSQTDLINIFSKDASDFVNQLQIDCNIDERLFKKSSESIYQTILECYNLFLDKKAKAYKVSNAIMAIILSYWHFCCDISDKKEDGWIIKDTNYLFFQPYINKCFNILEALRILTLNTLEKNEQDFVNKGETFNEDKFAKQCENNIETGINFLKNIF